HADIQRGHAQISRSQRPDRAATPHVTAHHKRLVRQTQFIADVTIKGGGTAVGGVTLIVVYLDDRPLIEQRPMVLIMTVHVVWMDTMGVIRRNHHGTGNGTGFPGTTPADRKSVV